MITLSVRKINYVNSIIGLLGKKRSNAIIFRTHFGIHTFGLHFPIDVVILDQQYRVAKLKENLLPWRVFVWNILYSIVLELPTGTIQEKKIRVGDKVDLVLV